MRTWKLLFEYVLLLLAKPNYKIKLTFIFASSNMNLSWLKVSNSISINISIVINLIYPQLSRTWGLHSDVSIIIADIYFSTFYWFIFLNLARACGRRHPFFYRKKKTLKKPKKIKKSQKTKKKIFFSSSFLLYTLFFFTSLSQKSCDNKTLLLKVHYKQHNILSYLTVSCRKHKWQSVPPLLVKYMQKVYPAWIGSSSVSWTWPL
jgi:hypothetical protein